MSLVLFQLRVLLYFIILNAFNSCYYWMPFIVVLIQFDLLIKMIIFFSDSRFFFVFVMVKFLPMFLMFSDRVSVTFVYLSQFDWNSLVGYLSLYRKKIIIVGYYFLNFISFSSYLVLLFSYITFDVQFQMDLIVINFIACKDLLIG